MAVIGVGLQWYWRQQDLKKPMPSLPDVQSFATWLPTALIVLAIIVAAFLNYRAMKLGPSEKRIASEGIPTAEAFGIGGSVKLGTAPKLQILSPRDKGEVGLREIVIGRVEPSGPVQVLVKSERSGYWYLQKRVDVFGSDWRVECQFGDDPGVGGGSYGVVAVYGDHFKLQEHQWLMPGVAQSEIVHVRRAPSNEPELLFDYDPKDGFHLSNRSNMDAVNVAIGKHIEGAFWVEWDCPTSVPRNSSLPVAVSVRNSATGKIMSKDPPAVFEKAWSGQILAAERFGNTLTVPIEIEYGSRSGHVLKRDWIINYELSTKKISVEWKS